MNEPKKSSYDVVVVGARCAGAATGMLLARRGLRVLAVDRGTYGSDTLSTHALMRAGVLQLKRWGLLETLEQAGTPVVRRTAFHYGEEEILVEIEPRDGIDGLYAPRRTVLDALLVDAARGAGAEVRHQMRCGRLLFDRERVSGVVLQDRDGQETSVEAGIVIGADGIRSTVAELVGAPFEHRGRHAGGVIFGYWSGLAAEGYHWYFEEGAGAGSIETDDGLRCVFAATTAERFARQVSADVRKGYRGILRECAPDLDRALDSGRLEVGLRGFPGQVGFLRRSHGPGWALVGDAGYFKDPITAHGISDALVDAELLAQAVASGTDDALRDYQSERDRRARPFLDLTDAIASFDWRSEEVQEMHRTLSALMKDEVRELQRRDREEECRVA